MIDKDFGHRMIEKDTKVERSAGEAGDRFVADADRVRGHLRIPGRAAVVEHSVAGAQQDGSALVVHEGLLKEKTAAWLHCQAYLLRCRGKAFHSITCARFGSQCLQLRRGFHDELVVDN